MKLETLVLYLIYATLQYEVVTVPLVRLPRISTFPSHYLQSSGGCVKPYKAWSERLVWTASQEPRLQDFLVS